MSRHLCHAMGCNVPVPPRMFMCKRHWYMLPKVIRDAVWAYYVPGQEITKTPTEEYLRVAAGAITWLAKYESQLASA